MNTLILNTIAIILVIGLILISIKIKDKVVKK